MSPWTSASLASLSMVLSLGSAAGQQLLPRNTRALSLDLCTERSGFLGPSFEISLYFIAVAQIVGDHGVDVRQLQRIVGPDHLFRSHAVLVMLNDQVEANA